jgi:glutamate/tyrosine decarboxylase-like PLP-dependent enzyme
MTGMAAEHNPISMNMTPATLDPDDWPTLRRQGHRMLDDMFDYLEHLRQRPVWQTVPAEVMTSFREPLPMQPQDPTLIHDIFMRDILPHAAANVHPGFMGGVQGGGTAVGMLAEMLAAGLNANCVGRDPVPLEVEWQILRWTRELFGFPETASGIFVTGASMANLIAVLVARTRACGSAVRQRGIANNDKRLTAYSSAAAHGCIARAMDMAGIGTDALRIVPVNGQHQMNTTALAEAIAADKRCGLLPFFIAGTAGSVDVGAIDDLTTIADIAEREEIWFHVDGALGALAMLAPEIAPRLAGLERADSIAFDFHKWGQVPYDAGFILVRDGALHRETFAAAAPYLGRESDATSGGSPWPCDFGPDLSRGFRALKTWFTIKTYGAAALGRVIATTCALASYLESRIAAIPEFELLAPVSLNIVCFRFICDDTDRINAALVAGLRESGLVAPSATRIAGRYAIRAAIVNHRTDIRDIDALLAVALELGRAEVGQATKRRF